MKKLISLLLVVSMVFTLCACGRIKAENVTLQFKGVDVSELKFDINQVDHDIKLEAIIEPSDAECEVIWSSSDPQIADVSSDGTLILKGAGQCDITVSCDEASSSVSLALTDLPIPKMCLLTEKFSSYEYGLETDYSYTYDENGNKLKCVNSNNMYSFPVITEYTYDENGNVLTESVSGSFTSKLEQTYRNNITYKYDDNTLIEETHKSNDQSAFALRYEYELDSSGRPTSIPTYYNNELRYTDSFEYDSNGNVTLERRTDNKEPFEYEINGMTLTMPSLYNTFTKYTYNDAGQVIKEEKSDNGESVSETILYEYDFYGVLISKTSESFDIQKTEYTYDEYGNVIKETVYENDELYSTTDITWDIIT